MTPLRDEPSNGNAEPFDITNPDLHGLAGYVASMSADMSIMKTEQLRQGKILEKIAISLEIPIDKSDPPPPFRKQLDSHREEIESLQKSRAEELVQIEALKKVDAETTGKMQAVTEDVAATKLIIRIGFVENMPKLVKVIGGLTAAIGALTLLGMQIWAALK